MPRVRASASVLVRRVVVVSPPVRGTLFCVSPASAAAPVLLRTVAVQAGPFESSKVLKPGYHISGSRVETRRFQAMGQHTAFNLYSPTEHVLEQ
jgi:hypothetical protein